MFMFKSLWKGQHNFKILQGTTNTTSMPLRVRSYCPRVPVIQGWFPFQLQAQFGRTHAYRGKRNKEHKNKSDKCKEENRGVWYHWLCVPWRALCLAAWIRLQEDPRDTEVKGTEDEGGHIWQAGDTEDVPGQTWNTPYSVMLWSWYCSLVNSMDLPIIISHTFNSLFCPNNTPLRSDPHVQNHVQIWCFIKKCPWVAKWKWTRMLHHVLHNATKGFPGVSMLTFANLVPNENVGEANRWVLKRKHC